MSKTLTLLFLVLGMATTAVAQKRGGIKGKLVDTVYKDNLAQATVSVLHPKDSTVVIFTIANDKGEFELKDIDQGTYRIMITYEGYKPFSRNFSISSDSAVVNFGNIYMEKKDNTLAAVIVEAPPIMVKKDTVEFNASAFKTKPNSVAEDLLKKLPGVQVDKDGNVKAQGEDIQKIYVDGKEFFGTDPKLATKNITADMIESVQVYDDMSDQAKFTRIDDGSRQKTINIKLRKDKRKGYFGRFIGGGGTDDRYETSIMFNKFDNDRRFSIIGGSNNINKSTFSFNDIVTTMGGFGSRNNANGGFGGGGGFGGFGGGGGGGRGGGGNASGRTVITSGLGNNGNSGGITKAINTGLNYTDKWGSKVDVTASDFYSNTNNNTDQTSQRQTTYNLPWGDSVAIQNEHSISSNLNQNHRVNLRMEYYIDSMTSLLYTPNLVVQHSESHSFDTLFTHSNSPLYKVDDFLENQGLSTNSNIRDGLTLNNNLLFRRKFHMPGRTLTIGYNNSIGSSNGNGTSFAPLQFYNYDGSPAGTLNQNIKNTQKTKTNNNVISTSYTEPIGNNKLLEFNYAYTNRYNTSDRIAYNYSPLSGKFDSINLPQTNYFENTYLVNRVGSNFRVQAKKYNFQLGGGVEFSTLSSRSVRAMYNFKDTTVKQNFVNFFPTANFQYQFSRSKNLRFSYRGRTNQPTISQLQDAVDPSNALQIKNGNPALKQEFYNAINFNYNTFNISTFKFLSVNINLQNTNNKIVNSIDSVPKGLPGVDPNVKGAQYIVPVNMNGPFNTSSFVTLGLPLRGKLKGSSFNFNNSLIYNRDYSLIFKKKTITNTFTATQTAGINFNIKDKLIFGLNASLAYNSVAYGGDSVTSPSQKYYTQTYSTDITWTFLKSLVLNTDFDYSINTGRSAGFNTAIPLWNASLAKQIFKKKNGELKFSVNDILNQNQSITRTVTNNYIEDDRTVVLKRYFMLTFTYNLNRAGNNQRQGAPGMPRYMQRQMNDQKGGDTPRGGGGRSGGGDVPE